MNQSSTAISRNDIELQFNYPEVDKNDGKTFIETIKKVNKMPFDKGEYYYSDNIWDFSKYSSLNIDKKVLQFNFNVCCSTYRDDLKNYILIQLLQNTSKIQTIHNEFLILNRFFNKAESDGFYNIKDITAQEIQSFLDLSSEMALSTQRLKKAAVKKFYSYYAANFDDLVTPELKRLFEHNNTKAYYAQKENNKIPDISNEYFNNFISACIKIADDETETLTHRAIACMYILISQTGLRIGECLGLEAGCLDTVEIFNGEKAYYINYKTWKREEGNNVYSMQRTYINDLSKKAYDILMQLYKEDRKKIGINNLYLGSKQTIAKNNYPISINAFSKAQLAFCGYLNKYFNIIDIDDSLYPEITRKPISHEKMITRCYPDAKTIAMPKNHQFRVHVCTELYNAGVPLKYIEKFMAHLSCEMEGYYVRPTKKNPQEDINFSLDVLKQIVSGETNLLGGASGLMEKINQFIAENNYNVATDLDEICEKLSAKIPIRQKTGGVCIKSSMLRECSKDAKTNEFYCAYGVCPNIFHFYYMADVSYRQAKELVETININKSRGLMRQVQKESHMLQTIINQKLMPELTELRNVIEKEGAITIMKKYPDLQNIIEHNSDIYKEIEQWKELTK